MSLLIITSRDDGTNGCLWVESPSHKNEGEVLPVYLEWVEQPSEQDWVDLEKLYKEAPDQWFADFGVADAQGYVAKHQDGESVLAAGRFNDRLITAASLQKHERGYLIQHLCVRSVTRERGVAHQLMVRLAQWADEKGLGLVVEANSPDLSTLLTKLEEYGFSLQDQLWIRTPA